MTIQLNRVTYLFKTRPFNALISFLRSSSIELSPEGVEAPIFIGALYGRYTCVEIYPVKSDIVCKVCWNGLFLDLTSRGTSKDNAFNDLMRGGSLSGVGGIYSQCVFEAVDVSTFSWVFEDDEGTTFPNSGEVESIFHNLVLTYCQIQQCYWVDLTYLVFEAILRN